ncbi:Transposase for insertion sequence element [Smittium culicis]|uniref:Transposase for insertion sequence element n=1 Tax=Smittium culicis TaxID=133412 RepID=A0A1R1XAA4_9FUNG|nr:Transposase for insertion sequence element [Smittium culicis]
MFLETYNSKEEVVFLQQSLDGENKTIPLAFGVFSHENQENWESFILDLSSSILGLSAKKNLIILSDRDKGLLNAISNKLPPAFHSLCVEHIKRNVISEFKKDFGPDIFRAAKTLEISVYHETMESIHNSDPKVYDYLKKFNPESWASVYFHAPRFGNVTSNIAESINSWISYERDLNILESLSNTLVKIKERFFNRRTKLENEKNEFPKEAIDTLNFNVTEGLKREIRQTGSYFFSVKGSKNGYRFVDMKEKSYTCGYY